MLAAPQRIIGEDGQRGIGKFLWIAVMKPGYPFRHRGNQGRPAPALPLPPGRTLPAYARARDTAARGTSELPRALGRDAG
jgi:hypothetical protein